MPLPLSSMFPNQIARQLAGAILALLLAAPAWAAPLLVTSAADDGPGSLREAVTLANARRGHDIIMFDAGLGPIELHSGQIDITEPLTLRGPKDGQLISGRQASRILAVIRRDIELHLENMILSGARTDQPGVFNDCSSRWGQGAALCSLGDVSLVGSHITDNLTIGEAAHGAGLFVRGRLTVKGSVIATNQTLGAMAHGAGISAFGAAEIVDSIIAGNAAIGRLSAGGGLSGRGEVLLSGTRVNENIAWAEAQTGIHLGVDASLTIEGIQPFDNFSVIDLEPKQGQAVSSALPRQEAQLHHDGLRVMLRTDERHKSSGDDSPQVDEWRVCSPPGAWGLGSVRIFFGSPEVGESSATWILTVFNNTHVSAEISSVSLSGNHPGDFEILTDNCTNTTLNNSSCEITLNATPQAGGERTARVDIESDATGNRFVPLYVGGQAELSLTPALLDFGAIEVDTFADQTVMVENTGDGTLALNSTDFSGASEFGLSASNCPVTLSPGASCSHTVRVQPTGPGELEGQFIVHSNAPSTPDAVTLVATACVDCLQAGMSLSPSELDFGLVSVGETAGPLNLTVSNTGTATLNVHSLSAISAPFTPSGGNCGDIPFSLDSGASCTLGFSFSPAEAGSYVISPQFSANVLTNPAFTLLGVGTEPVLELDRSDIDFGSHPVGGSGVGDGFTISNAGTADLDIGTLVLAGDHPGDFLIASDACSNQTLAPAAQCAVGISAEPQAAGTRTARIDFTSNAASSPHSVSLDVEGLQAELVLSDTLLDFGNVPVGQVESMSLTVANSGSWELEINAITPSAAPFDRTGGSCPEPQFVLAVGEQCSLEYSFAPTVRDSAEQPITVSSSVGDAAFSLEGTGIAPVLEIDADGIDFGDVEIGTSASENLLLENTGDIALVLGELLISGPDAAGFTLPVDDCSGQSLPPASACSVTVTVTPSLPGPLVAQIDIPSNALSTPDAVTLSATGTQADIDLAPAELDFGPVPVGQAAEVLTLTVSNTGTATLVVDALSTVNAPFAPADGSCGDAPFSVATGESCTLEFSFSPIEAGPFEEIIEVSANVPTNPAFTLLGVGTEPILELDRSDIDFGPVAIGSDSAPEALVLHNSGSAELAIAAITLSGDQAADFELADDGCSQQLLAPATSCTLLLTVKPSDVGRRDAVLEIASNASTTLETVELTATGAQGMLSLDLTILDLGLIAPGAASSGVATLSNTGSVPLQIEGISAPAEPFTLSDGSCLPVPATLDAGVSCAIEVRFAPLVGGEFSGNILIDSNSPTSPDTIVLSGQAVDALPVPVLNPRGLLILILLIAGIGSLVASRMGR